MKERRKIWNKEIIYEVKGKVLNYNFSKIIQLKYYRTYGKGSGWNSFGMYRCYKIKFSDNTEIFITCFMINDIENTLEAITYGIRKTLQVPLFAVKISIHQIYG